MKAAIVTAKGKPPIYGDFKDPIATPHEPVISVTASALSHLTKGRASGTHYSSTDQFPFVPGVDGVGRMSDGKRVYFVLPTSPYGGMAEKTLVHAARCVPLPEALDDLTAAAIANPGMSSWTALKMRARLAKGETVLINGATGNAGRLAIQVAKHLGAKKVIATGRNRNILESLKSLGADDIITLVEEGDALEEAFKKHFNTGIDVVLDYLWGQSAERLLIAGAKASEEGVPIRFVQVGAVSSDKISLPAAALRSSAIELIGSGLGSVSETQLLNAIRELLEATPVAKFKIEADPIPLNQVERVWDQDNSLQRIVLTMR